MLSRNRLLAFCLAVTLTPVIHAAKDDKSEQKWDVNNPPGEAYQADIDVDQGTWMNLDVSPDGKTLAFDLLGDIYTMPISGGEATNITNSIAWDMQPRFSPDGDSLAFTSDQGGGDNIWTMDVDGSNQHQVSKESFRLLNNPVWSPDGRTIAARKHFTSRRSLGAGEIWLYHYSGGNGIQLNKRPNDQKDLGEPAFSADGDYVYFSRDSTPGNVFEYSKDSNSQIYEIFRIDLNTGDIDGVVSGAGGAVRPTPSPDGKHLAFVRRIRNKTALFLKNLETGEETPLYDGLDRDMQETWAIHGVYPNFAWTPDSESLVFWAGGKIKRININLQKAVTIPFQVVDQREMRKAVRFTVDVAPDQFKAKMLRWVTTSPRGNKVVFQALGHLYLMDLPDGEPVRLTNQDDHFEMYPSFSRDGQWIVYTTWDDQKLGTVRKVNVFGNKEQDLTSEPGHYVNPRFSLDGKQVVYEKVSGGYLTNPNYSMNTGIYTVKAVGGENHRISKSGRQPFFGPDGERVYYTQSGGSGSDRYQELVSVDLNGHEQRSHYKSSWASEFSLSPDGNWLALVERFQVYVTPFISGGKTISTGPGSKNLPIEKLSKYAGSNLHWSGDSQNVLWSQGSILYQQELANAFKFLAKESVAAATEQSAEASENEKPAGKVPPRVYVIDLEVESDKPEGVTALIGARIISMNGDEVIPNGTIVIEDNRIKSIGKSSDVTVPIGATRIDVAGKTIIPGLVDAHWHGGFGNRQIIPEENWSNYASLMFGVTTIHDPSNDTQRVFAASEMARAGQIVAPRIFSTGTILYGAKTSFTAEVDSLEDAIGHLQRMKSVGAFSVKSYNQPRRDQRQQVLEAARRLGIMVVPEGGSLFQHNMSMIVDGHTGIEHSVPVAQLYDDVLQLWSQSETGYTPTLVVAYGGIWGENYWYQNTEVWRHPLLKRYVPRQYVEPRSVRRDMAPESDYNHFNIARGAKQLQDVGVGVQLGAHGQREGLGVHWELWMFEQGGMTPHQALRVATLNGAKYLGMDKDIGSLEPGKLADLVILDANPLENIRNSDKVNMVMLNGRLYDSATGNQIGRYKSKREPFYFEEPMQ